MKTSPRGRARPPSRRREAPLLGPGPSAQARLQEAGHGLGIHLSPRGQEGAPPGAPQEKVRAEPAGPAVGLVQPLGRLARPVLHRARAEAPDQGKSSTGTPRNPSHAPWEAAGPMAPKRRKRRKRTPKRPLRTFAPQSPFRPSAPPAPGPSGRAQELAGHGLQGPRPQAVVRPPPHPHPLHQARLAEDAEVVAHRGGGEAGLLLEVAEADAVGRAATGVLGRLLVGKLSEEPHDPHPGRVGQGPRR